MSSEMIQTPAVLVLGLLVVVGCNSHDSRVGYVLQEIRTQERRIERLEQRGRQAREKRSDQTSSTTTYCCDARCDCTSTVADAGEDSHMTHKVVVDKCVFCTCGWPCRCTVPESLDPCQSKPAPAFVVDGHVSPCAAKCRCESKHTKYGRSTSHAPSDCPCGEIGCYCRMPVEQMRRKEWEHLRKSGR